MGKVFNFFLEKVWSICQSSLPHEIQRKLTLVDARLDSKIESPLLSFLQQPVSQSQPSPGFGVLNGGSRILRIARRIFRKIFVFVRKTEIRKFKQ